MQTALYSPVKASVITLFIFATPAVPQAVDVDALIGRIITDLTAEVAEISGHSCGSILTEPPIPELSIDSTVPADLRLAVEFEAVSRDLSLYVASVRAELRSIRPSALALESRLNDADWTIGLPDGTTPEDAASLAVHARADEVERSLQTRRGAIESLLTRCEETIARLMISEAIAMDARAVFRELAAYHRAVPPGFDAFSLSAEIMSELPSDAEVRMEALQYAAATSLARMTARLEAIQAAADGEARRLAPIRSIQTALGVIQFMIKAYEFVDEHIITTPADNVLILDAGGESDETQQSGTVEIRGSERATAEGSGSRPMSVSVNEPNFTGTDSGPQAGLLEQTPNALQLEVLWRRIDRAAPNVMSIANMTAEERDGYIGDLYFAFRLLDRMGDTPGDVRVRNNQIGWTDFVPDPTCGGPLCVAEFIVNSIAAPTVMGDGTIFGAGHRQLRREQLNEHLGNWRLWNDVHDGRDPLVRVLGPQQRVIEWPAPEPTIRILP